MSIQLYSSPMKYKDPNTGNYVDIIGISGNPGRGISSVELNNDYTLTITFTDGTSTTTSSIRGAQGVGIRSVEKTNTSGLVDTYTITFDDNTISTFQVTNGASIDLHICAQGEYDSTTRVPTIQNPDSRTFYLVPNEDSAVPNAYTEWLYANGAWERFGAQVIDLSGYATKAGTVLETTLSRGRKAGTTIGLGSLAFGNDVEASNTYTMAFGHKTSATGPNAYSEGNQTLASGNASHAEGFKSIANGAGSHAEGSNTIANAAYSHVEGKYNIEDNIQSWSTWTPNTEYVVGDKVKMLVVNSNNETSFSGYICKTANNDAEFVAANWTRTTFMNYPYIIGNGTADNARSNAYALDWDGNGHFMGDVYVGANVDSSGGEKLVKESDVPVESGAGAGSVQNKDAGGLTGGTASGVSSIAIGQNVHATGNYSTAFGGSATQAQGTMSFAAGWGTLAFGTGSHAEGGTTKAIGGYSHAEGNKTIANGNRSHAEGSNTIANGSDSHTSGKYNIEDSYSSWPEWVANTEYMTGDKIKVTVTANNETTITGYICKTANNDAEFTVANWTKDTAMNFVEIIGNGTSATRSNARALDWEGNEYLAGDLYVGANTDSSGGTKVATIDDIQQVATLEEVEEIITSYEEDEDMIFEMTIVNKGHGEFEYKSVDPTETILDAYTSGKHVILHFPYSESLTLPNCYASILSYNEEEERLTFGGLNIGEFLLTELSISGDEYITITP